MDKMYASLVSLWKRLLPDENAAAKERFLTYCKEANLQLREDELKEFNTQKQMKKTGFYKSVRNYGLPPEYDLNYQYELMRKCEADAKLEQETKKEAKKEAKKAQKPVNKIETKILEAERFVTDLTKEKLQRLVAKYSPKNLKSSQEKTKLK